MQIEIKTLKALPLRQTYGHVARRFGDKPASRYQEATYDIQPTTNFHYRPTWAPEFELFDTSRTQIRMKDWYALKDPRQYYYGAYVTARARQQEAAEGAFDLVERRGLLAALSYEWQERLIAGLLPLRHIEWGANMNNTLCADYGYGTALTQACTFCAMDRLGIAKASVVGNSIGGRIAWTFAAGHPERVDKLVLVSPDGFESPGFEYGRRPDVPSTVKLMRWVLPKPLVKMSLAPAYADPKVMTDALATRYYDLMRAPGVRDAMIARMEQSIRFDPVARLQTIRAPTLLLWGEQDRMIPFTNAADYQKAIPRAKLVPLPGVGHLPQEEAPQRSLAVVREFLR